MQIVLAFIHTIRVPYLIITRKRWQNLGPEKALERSTFTKISLGKKEEINPPQPKTFCFL